MPAHSSKAMENSTADLAKVRVSKADIFLLERWQEDSPLSMDAQREQIFTEFIKLGVRGREQYEPKKKIGGPTASYLPPHSRELLYRIRPQRLTRPFFAADVYWLRTCYKPEHEHAWKRIVEEHLNGLVEEHEILNDASLYNFHENWDQIFLFRPELLGTGYTADRYDERVQEAFDDVIEYQPNYEARDEEYGYYSDEEDNVRRLCFSYHTALVMHRIHIVDEITLSSKGPDAGKVLIVFFDECGRVVRYSRAEAHYSAEITALSNCYLDDHPCWAFGELGEDYTHGGELGPPYAKDAGESQGASDFQIEAQS